MSLTDKALFAIERNLNRELSLGEIAERVGVSRFHLAHAFGEQGASGRVGPRFSRSGAGRLDRAHRRSEVVARALSGISAWPTLTR